MSSSSYFLLFICSISYLLFPRHLLFLSNKNKNNFIKEALIASRKLKIKAQERKNREEKENADGV